MAATPPDGSFPRLNSSMVRKGSFAGMLASLVGKFEDSKTFRCCDGGTVQIIDFQDAEENMKQDLVVEIMGQVEGQESFSVFVVREFSQDTDLALYNNMIEIQHNSKFDQFFKQPGVTW